MLPAIIGVIILAIVIYVAFKMIGSIAVGLGLIAIVFVASYFILGSVPDLRAVPIIGKYLPEFPSTTGEAIAIIRNVFYSLKVLDVSKDAEGKLLVTVANTGKMELSGIKIFIDGQQVGVLNNPEDPLESGKVTVMQLDWKEAYTKIEIRSSQGSFTYPE